MTDISVLIPVYNLESYGVDNVGRTFDSCLIYENQDVEIIAVDDASTDNSLEILYKWQDSNPAIKVISKTRHLGVASSLNIANRFATGEYRIYCSTRGRFEPGVLSRLRVALDVQSDPQVKFVYGQTIYHTSAGFRIHRPGGFNAEEYKYSFPSLQGYLYHRKAFDLGLTYTTACRYEGKWIYPCDHQFITDCVKYLDWVGLPLDLPVYHYKLDYSGQQTHTLARHPEVMEAFYKLMNMDGD